MFRCAQHDGPRIVTLFSFRQVISVLTYAQPRCDGYGSGLRLAIRPEPTPPCHLENRAH